MTKPLFNFPTLERPPLTTTEARIVRGYFERRTSAAIALDLGLSGRHVAQRLRRLEAMGYPVSARRDQVTKRMSGFGQGAPRDA